MDARLVIALGFALGAVACAGSREPPRPVADDFVEVEYPPPPAQVEELQEELAGRPECVWQDGHYEWAGRRYRWTPGEWVVPPEGCAYAPLAMTWVRGNPARLYYTPPRWYRADVSSGAPPAPCAAPTPCQIRNLRPQ